MTIIELIQSAKSQGFYPIHIDGDASESGKGDLFQGSVEEYFAALKYLEVKALLVQLNKLEESNFIYEAEVFSDDDSEEEIKTIDLVLVNSTLQEFKKYIGSEYAIRLSAKTELIALDKYVEASWWQSFLSEQEKAIEQIEENQEAILTKIVEAKIQKAKELIKLVKGLINDPDFVTISTQGGMRAYALEKYPDLEIVEPRLLTQEIRLVNDRIKAKGLNRKISRKAQE